MSIDAYFREIAQLIVTCPIIESSNVTYDRRARYVGYIRGDLFFRDGSMLHVREYVDTEDTAERLLYVYQYMNDTQVLVFRYDNTGHHKKLNLPTYPHHKHVGTADVVESSTAPSLADVLDEVMSTIELP